MTNLKVNEIFYSLQGESSYIGLPCIFIRLTGCNLNCSYCDTKYARTIGKDYSIIEIISQIKKINCNLVELTGGEPLLQDNVYSLMNKLIEKKYKVLLETNGSISLKNVPKNIIKIVDLKCPNSGMSDKMDFNNLKFLSFNDEIKFVIKSRKDYLWAKKIILEYKLNKLVQIIMSPVSENIEPQKLAGWILKDNLDVRFQVQLHKIINVK